MNPKNLLKDNLDKNIKELFKGFLNTIEDLHADHQRTFSKLRSALPEEYEAIINMADYFDYDKLQHIRKRILDVGNESLRKNDSELEKVNLKFEFKQ